MNDLMEHVTQGEAMKFNGGGELAAAAAPAQYRSTWVPDSNSANHKVIFQHGLGVIPSEVIVTFSADLQTAYPLLWSWDNGYSGNPVTIAMDAQSVVLNIFSGSPLHGFWDPNNGWTTYSNGYWRVTAFA